MSVKLFDTKEVQDFLTKRRRRNANPGPMVYMIAENSVEVQKHRVYVIVTSPFDASLVVKGETAIPQAVRQAVDRLNKCLTGIKLKPVGQIPQFKGQYPAVHPGRDA